MKLTNITVFHNSGLQITAKTELTPAQIHAMLVRASDGYVFIPTESNENEGEEGLILERGTFFLTVSNKVTERKADIIIPRPKLK